MKTLAILLTLLLAPALAASELDTLLDEAAAVKAGDHKAWLEARGRIIALGEDALPGLRAAGAEANWTQDGWLRAMVAEACRLRIDKPETAAAVDAPRGIDPAHYKLFRKPEPACQHDLKNLGADAVPLLLERWRWTLESHAYSEGEAGSTERDCFARAILFVPGFLADRRARFALQAALEDISLPEGWRATAAVSLGQTAGTDALPALEKLFDDDTQATAVREACGWAFGRVADIKAADAIKSRLARENLPAGLRRALLTGVGLLGSAWAWKARGLMRQAAGDEVRESCARMLLEALKSNPEEHDFISRALALTAWNASLEWVRELADTADSQPVRDAARACLEPLQTAIRRNK
ncbi:MAG: hypothetical protein M5U25_15815 [Planctomycetota bacterium]|nr:hypothetical protein [Planctomycetota bacterium]